MSLKSIFGKILGVTETVLPLAAPGIGTVIDGAIQTAETLFAGLPKAGTNKKAFVEALISDALEIFGSATGKTAESSQLSAAISTAIDSAVAVKNLLPAALGGFTAAAATPAPATPAPQTPA